jgi:glutaredoxin
MIARALLLAWLLLLSLAAAAVEPQPDIEAFVRAGCPHCVEAKVFLDELQREQPQLRIVIVDVVHDPAALERLQHLMVQRGEQAVRVPALRVGGQVFVGYSKGVTDRLIREGLAQRSTAAPPAASCGAAQLPSCGPDAARTPAEIFSLDFFGHPLMLDDIGLPLFTLAMGLLDGFNPCSMWVLILMISLLAQLHNRPRMLAIAGTFVAVQGFAYFLFMAAWLNLFLFVGLSRVSEVAIAVIALLAGAVNLKDFWHFGKGFSLSIPAGAKPGIYARMRAILQAGNMAMALLGTLVLAVLVQIVELMCTSGFPALYTRILTLRHLDPLEYYAYLLLYDAAYMLDDAIVLVIGVITLSQRRLQEREGRLLKLFSALVMIGLGIYLLLL